MEYKVTISSSPHKTIKAKKEEQISIIYVDKNERGSVCYPIRLDDNGDFIDKWPKGFFEENINELFDL